MTNSDMEDDDDGLRTDDTVESQLPAEPDCMLTSLDGVLGNDGNIKDMDDVTSVAQFMGKADKMADRCCALNILRATKDRTILEKVLEDGGWLALYKWLEEARAKENVPFLQEILKVYRDLPVTVDMLKQNSCAKEIKHLIKFTDDKVCNFAKAIIDNWMVKVKSKSDHKNDSKNHSPNHRSDHSHKDKEKLNNSVTNREPDKSSPNLSKPDKRTDRSDSSELSADSGISVKQDGSKPTKDSVHKHKTTKIFDATLNSSGNRSSVSI